MTSRRMTARFRWHRTLFLIVPLLAAVIGTSFISTPAARAGCNGDNNCYGLNQWPGTNHGAAAWIETVHLYSSNTTDHINNTLWVIDTSHDCSGHGFSWIEAGEATQQGHTGNWYYWDDCRPGSSEYKHFQYQPPSGDVYQYQNYVIYRSASNTFSVSMYNASSGGLQWSGTSTSNTMGINLINVGLETTSLTNTHSDNANFAENMYYSSTTSTWYFQPVDGNYNNLNPPTFSWNVPPHLSSSGGNGTTSCC